MIDRFPGKHLAVVADNDDPKALSRVKVQVPEIFEDWTTGWCLPCSPYAGAGVGLAVVPPVGSVVFVEWPDGDTTRPPVWSGGCWTDGNGVPGAKPDVLVLATKAHTVTLDDTDGKERIEIEAKSGAKVTMDDKGLSLEFGKQTVKLEQSKVSVNGTALVVKT